MSKKFFRRFLPILLMIFAYQGLRLSLSYSSLTSPQQVCLAMAIMACFFWLTEMVPLFLVSFMTLAIAGRELAPLLPKVERTDFLTFFFSPTILLFLGGFVLSKLLNRYGIDRSLAHWAMAKTQGRTKALLAVTLATSGFLSMWMSNTATTAMMLTLILPVYHRLSSSGHSGKALILAVPVGCNIGGFATPIGSPPNAIAMSVLESLNAPLTFMGWVGFGVPTVMVLLTAAWWLLLYLFPIDVKVIDLEKAPEIETEYSQKEMMVAAGIFLLTLAMWLFGSMIGWKSDEVALIPILLSFGLGLLKTEDFKGIPWDILTLIAGGLCLGFSVQASGLDQWLLGLVPGHLDPLMQLVLFLLITTFMTSIMSNTATASILLPLAVSVYAGVAMKHSVAAALALCCSTAMFLPVSTPPNAIAFSSGYIESKDLVKVGGCVTLISYLVIPVIIALGFN